MREAPYYRAALRSLLMRLVDMTVFARENMERALTDNENAPNYSYEFGKLMGIDLSIDQVVAYIKMTGDDELIKWAEDYWNRYKEIHYGNQGT